MADSTPPVSVGAITALIEAGSTDLQYSPEGESVEQPTRWAPATRDEERAVAKVPRQQKPSVDLTAINIEDLQQSDMSPLALVLATERPPAPIHPEIVQRYHTAVAEVREIFDSFNGVDWEGLEQQDPGRAALLAQKFAVALSERRSLREWISETENVAQWIHGQQQRHADIQALLGAFPFLSSKAQYSAAMKWCCSHYGITEQQALAAPPDDVVAALHEYVAHCSKRGKKLTRSATAAMRGEVISAAAKAEAKRSGRELSIERKAALVSALLEGI